MSKCQFLDCDPIPVGNIIKFLCKNNEELTQDEIFKVKGILESYNDLKLCAEFCILDYDAVKSYNHATRVESFTVPLFNDDRFKALYNRIKDFNLEGENNDTKTT